MAKRGRPPKPAPVPAEDPDLLDIGGLTEAEDDFLSFLDDIAPETSTVDIYRVTREGTQEWCETLFFDVFREGGLPYIRDRWGGGRFRFLFRGQGKKYRGHKTVVLSQAPIGASAPAASAGTATTLESLQIQLLTQQLNNQQALLLRLIESGARGGGGGTDPAAMLTAVVTAFGVLKSATAEGPATGDPVKALKSTLELIRESRDLTGGGSSEGGREDNLYSVLRDVAGNLLPVFGRSTGAAVPPGPAAPAMIHAGTNFKVSALPAPGAPQIPTPAIPQSVNTRPPQEELNAEQWIRAGLEYLKQKALRGKPVDFYIDAIFENDDEPQFSALLQAIQLGATFDNLLQFDPQIANNAGLRSWFEQLYTGITKELSPALDTGGAGGHPADTGGNEAPGAPGPADTGDRGSGA